MRKVDGQGSARLALRTLRGSNAGAVPGSLDHALVKSIGLAVALTLGLAACGGGSNSPASPNPPPAAPPPPPPPPPQDPPPAVDPPAIDVHLALTGAAGAQAQGYTGAGVRVAVVDTGVNRDHPALSGRVVANQVYIDPSSNDTRVDDVVGHGTWVSQILAGRAVGQWPGGVAPGAEIVSARIISDEPPEDDGSGQGNEIGDSSIGDFFEFLHGNLMQAGAQVMNNSWGGLYWTSDAVTQSFVDAYAPFITQYGGLVVFATGNSGFDDPSDTAALPGKSAAAAALEQGWLAVAALDSNNPDQLASYSNACGSAMDYCLVAPGRVVVTGHDDLAGDPSYWVVGGTSFAAPQVSGAAALVWEAFPYFDNDLVRQTLLGTATDMGAPGPDPVFGHGLLDADAAVRGPGRFDWGDVEVAFAGTSRWSNPISGDGGLVKRGPGTLVLGRGLEEGIWTNMSFQGDTRVEQGVLRLEETRLLASDLHVAAGAGLELAGARLSNVENFGRMDLVEQTSSIHGDYLHDASATLGVMVGSQMWVQGTSWIQGGSLQVLGVLYGHEHTENALLITANEGVQGEFDRVTVADSVLFEGSLRYLADQVWLDIERLEVSAAGLALEGASLASAVRLDAAFASLDQWRAAPAGASPGTEGFMEGARRFHQAATHESAELSVRSLSGEIHATQRAAVMDAIDAGSAALGRRVASRLGSGLGEGLASSWASGLGSGRGLGSEGFASGQVRTGGQVVGVDQRVGSAVLGLSLSKSRTDTALEGLGGSARSLVDEAALYAGHRAGEGYLQGRIAAGRVNQQVQRRLLIGRDLVGVASRYGAHYTAIDIEAGRDYSLAGVRLTPFVSSQWARLDSDAFAEMGAWGFGLRSDRQAHAHWQAGAGVDLGRGWTAPNGFTHRISGRLQWQQSLGGSDAFDARFVGIDAGAPVAGAGFGRQRLSLDMGLESDLGRHGRLELDARQVLGPDARDTTQLSVGFRRAF